MWDINDLIPFSEKIEVPVKSLGLRVHLHGFIILNNFIQSCFTGRKSETFYSRWCQIQEHMGRTYQHCPKSRMETAVCGPEHQLYQGSQWRLCWFLLYLVIAVRFAMYGPSESLMVFVLKIVPSVAIGFTAYDMMKVWLHIPPRQKSRSVSNS